MSYSGYIEYLTTSGRYLTQDAFDDTLIIRDDPIRYRHSVDTTNGYDENYPESCDAPKIKIGDIERKHVDFKGNVYFTQEPVYVPANYNSWSRVK